MPREADGRQGENQPVGDVPQQTIEEIAVYGELFQPAGGKECCL